MAHMSSKLSYEFVFNVLPFHKRNSLTLVPIRGFTYFYQRAPCPGNRKELRHIAAVYVSFARTSMMFVFLLKSFRCTLKT